MEENNNKDNLDKTIINKSVSDNFEFSLNINDTLLVLTRNNSLYKENLNYIISKMIIINELNYVNLDDLSKILGSIGIDKLNIFYLNNTIELNTMNIITANNTSKITFLEMRSEQFVKFLNFEHSNFIVYNKDSLYIIKDSNFLEIKNLFSIINSGPITLCRGGSQKSHMLSPLDLRLTSYLMAMFNFDYKLINNLNTFNYISKDRYLSWTDKQTLFKKSKGEK